MRGSSKAAGDGAHEQGGEGGEEAAAKRKAKVRINPNSNPNLTLTLTLTLTKSVVDFMRERLEQQACRGRIGVVVAVGVG